jgi:hypothetical protein
MLFWEGSKVELMTDNEVAELLGISPGTLRNRRAAKKEGPAWIKPGKKVLYNKVTVENWLLAQEALSIPKKQKVYKLRGK